ncbi:hypothetical protein ACN28S_19145 [Cystobacter fuscus]
MTASEALKLSEARLADAELLLRQQSPGARTCGDDAVRERLESAVAERRAALRSVGTRLPRLAPVLLEAARARDPPGTSGPRPSGSWRGRPPESPGRIAGM